MATPQEDYPNPPFTGDELDAFYDYVTKTREAYGAVDEWQAHKDGMQSTFAVASPLVMGYQQNTNYAGQEVGHLIDAFRSELNSSDWQGFYRQLEFIW